MPDHAVITHHHAAVDDDAPMMFNAQPAPYRCSGTDRDATHELQSACNDKINDGPRKAQQTVSHNKTCVSESIYEERPKSEGQGAFTLRFQIFDDQPHTGAPRVELGGPEGT